MKDTETTFLIVSLRHTVDQDTETDFVVNDEHFIIQAIERANLLQLTDAENKIKARYPKNLTLITYLPLLETLSLGIQIQDIESEMIKEGCPIPNIRNNHRIDDAFNWQNKFDEVRKIGNC